MVLEWMDFLDIRNNAAWGLNQTLAVEALDVLFSMLTTEFATGNPARTLDDTNQLEYKKSFDGPYHFRTSGVTLEDDSGAPASHAVIQSDDMPMGPRVMRYVPPIPLDLPTPLIITLINRSRLYTTLDLITEGTDPSYLAASLEFFAIRVWYSKRKRTQAEKIGIDAKGTKKFLDLGA